MCTLLLFRCSPQEQFDLVCTSGRPFCLLDVRLMGPEGTPLEHGSHQVGEVQCRGPTVFQGYWQLPQASSEAFTDDGWFRTGDLATANQAGYITVVDRIKDMILHGPFLPHTHTHSDSQVDVLIHNMQWLMERWQTPSNDQHFVLARVSLSSLEVLSQGVGLSAVLHVQAVKMCIVVRWKRC